MYHLNVTKLIRGLPHDPLGTFKQVDDSLTMTAPGPHLVVDKETLHGIVRIHRLLAHYFHALYIVILDADQLQGGSIQLVGTTGLESDFQVQHKHVSQLRMALADAQHHVVVVKVVGHREGAFVEIGEGLIRRRADVAWLGKNSRRKRQRLGTIVNSHIAQVIAAGVESLNIDGLHCQRHRVRQCHRATEDNTLGCYFCQV